MNSLIHIVLVAALTKSVQNQGSGRRMVGGFNKKIEDAPYQVAVHFNDVFDCGGALLSERFVLSAAHCKFKTIKVRTSPILIPSLRLYRRSN